MRREENLKLGRQIVLLEEANNELEASRATLSRQTGLAAEKNARLEDLASLKYHNTKDAEIRAEDAKAQQLEAVQQLLQRSADLSFMRRSVL
jgi:hypothetical protein